MKRVLIMFGLLCCCQLSGWTLAAERAAEDATEEALDTAKPATVNHAAHVTALADRGAALAEREEVVWLQDDRHWMVVRPARTAVRGTVLLLADGDASANGVSHMAALRRHVQDRRAVRRHFSQHELSDGIALLRTCGTRGDWD